MIIKITATSKIIDNYVLFLGKYNYNFEDSTIEVNSLEDLITLCRGIEQELILKTKEGVPEIEIYDYFRE